MNPYYVLPVWSFDGPSRHDGVCVGSLCEPLLACHSIRFSRFKLQRIPLTTCGFPCCVPPVVRSAARRYITHSPEPCQQVVEALFRRLSPSPTRLIRDAKSASRSCPGGAHKAEYRPHRCGFSAAYGLISERLSVFNTRSGLLWGSGGAVSYCTRQQIRVQGISPT